MDPATSENIHDPGYRVFNDYYLNSPHSDKHTILCKISMLDGITIEKKKRDKEIFENDEDDRDTRVRIGKDEEDDAAGIEIRREDK